MIRGEAVTVHRRVCGGMDPIGNPTVLWEDEEVDGVIVAPGGTSDANGGTRPDGKDASYSLHFPKGYIYPLAGCEVTVRGERLKIAGVPTPYTLENTPGRWHMQAEAVRRDG